MYENLGNTNIVFKTFNVRLTKIKTKHEIQFWVYDIQIPKLMMIFTD